MTSLPRLCTVGLMLAGTSVRWKGMCLHAEFAEVLQSLRENGHEVLPLFLPDEVSLYI